MKSMKRKLLSLLLAMAMVLTLAPTALADGITVTAAQGNASEVTVGQTINLSVSASGGTPADGASSVEYSYSWTAGNNAEIVSGGDTATASVRGTNAGSGSVSVTVTNKSNSSESGSVTLNFTVKSSTVPVEGVSITEGTTASATAGGTLQLHATVTPNNATTPGVTWSSGDPSKATVSTSGLVSIVANATGSVVITATSVGEKADGQKASASCTVNITPSTVSADRIVISGTGVTGGTNNVYSLTMNAGTNASITAQLYGTDNKPMTSAGVMTIGGGTAGVCTGGISGNTVTLTAGTTVITQQTATFSISCDGKSATLNVTVVPVSTITATLGNPAASTIYYGASANNSTTTLLSVTAGDATGYTVGWEISPANAVTITKSSNVAASGITGDYIITAGSVSSPTTVTIRAKLTKGQTSVSTNAITVTVSPYNSLTLNPTSGTPATNTIVYLNNWTGNNDAEWKDFAVNATWYQNGSVQQIGNNSLRYSWTLNGTPLTNTSSTSNSYRLYSSTYGLKYGNQDNTLTCTVELYNGNSRVAWNSISWTIRSGYAGNVLATATVSTSTSSYALGDLDDAGKSSIVSQLDSSFYNINNGRYGLAYVSFSSVRDGNNGSLNATVGTYYYADRQASGVNARYLSDVLFYPGTTKTTASFPVTVYYYTGNYQTASNITSVAGTITFSVTEGVSTGDITYSASIGEDVSFTLKDFEDFYYSKTRGSLNYVTFTLPSGGSLYADTGRLSSNNACYASPSRTQTDLAGVYFSPTGTTATRANTVRISFTAYGTRSNTSGTVAITYLAGAAKDITYNANTTAVLKASDFTDAYRQVVGSTAPTGLTIQFQTVPTYGTLTYKNSSSSSSSTVTLRSSNIKSYNFTTRTTGSNQLGDVTYTASGNRSDTIEYIAYVNNTPQFTGKVVFNGSNTSATNMQVTFTSANGQAVAFSYAEFAKANATTIASTSYIRFVTMPTGGTLTYNGAAMTLSSTNVVPTMLGNVVYRPSTGFNNSTDRISFLCYDANGNSVGGGQVSIIVTGNTGTTSNGVSNISQFKDVSATAWYASDLSTLINAGIIQGRGDGKFDPTAELTYGEALKIFMLASGYPAQQEASGKDWAINYKNLAVSNGWISSSIDLSARISRNAMAELAAKSLGVSPNSTVPPTWKDGTSNTYANALYYTNPQILIGNADGTFKGTSTLLRQEICAIASRVLTYRNSVQSLDKPGWLA